MKFELGPGVRCDLQKLIDTRALVQANSGGGKSHTLRRLLEQTHGRVQQLVIDPEGEFASLRERYDYVLAARHGGDTAADPRAAKLLAERLLQLGVSAILDIERGFCAVCHDPAPKKHVVPWVQEHAARHLAEASAVVIVREGQERVVPTDSLPSDEQDRIEHEYIMRGNPHAPPPKGVIQSTPLRGVPAGYELRDGMLRKRRTP